MIHPVRKDRNCVKGALRIFWAFCNQIYTTCGICYHATTWTGPPRRKLTNQNINWDLLSGIFFMNAIEGLIDKKTWILSTLLCFIHSVDWVLDGKLSLSNISPEKISLKTGFAITKSKPLKSAQNLESKLTNQ